eukprot:TRINITY_DN6277_c0_g1_i2.p1 TRINITY_DN6277_c0_g1~~TRINITY_DN6277_c0_g1_i2.p1  ORF type:complete len:355 (+),score=64.91 TRINITY_DN6277_c0_g1_i2:670-1734(+)
MTAFHQAIMTGNCEILDLLFPLITNINQPDGKGNTPLQIASDRRRSVSGFSTSLDNVKWLIEHGADVNVPDMQGNTLMHMVNISAEFIDLIASHDIMPLTVKNESGKYPIDIHIGEGKVHNVSVILKYYKDNEISLDHGRLSTVKDSMGRNICYLLGESDLVDALSFVLSDCHDAINVYQLNESSFMNSLLRVHSTKCIYHVAEVYNLEFDHDQCTKLNGDSILHTAVKHNSYDFIRMLIGKGVDINEIQEDMDNYSDGGQAIHIACVSGALESLKILLNHPDVNINSQENPRRDTPLHICSSFGNHQCMGLLLEHPDIDINIQNVYDCTALDEAHDSENKECIALLKKYKSNM